MASDLQRYDPIDDAGSGYGRMRQCVDGDYVRHDDTLALREENTELKLRREETVAMCALLSEENTRLRALLALARTGIADIDKDYPCERWLELIQRIDAALGEGGGQ